MGPRVRCSDCQREYDASPDDDFYDQDSEAGGCCLDCLLKRNGLTAKGGPVEVYVDDDSVAVAYKIEKR